MVKKYRPQPVIITATTLQRKVGSVIRRAYKDKQRFIVERGGLPVIAIISFAEYEALFAKRRSPNHTSQD
jgi:prevent-host-death family protein